LEMHYTRSPFLNQYLPTLRTIYAEPWMKLADLNLAVIRWLLQAYGITTPLRCASEMVAREEPTDRLIDLCRAVGATQYLAGPGAEGYMDKSRFEASGVELEMQEFLHPEYGQRYEPFEPNLSAIDLLLCVGPEALNQLRSRRVRQDQATVSSRS
jgi:hypothetical protein